MDNEASLRAVGKIAGVFGIKGWLKINSYTEPSENLFEYSPWWFKKQGEWLKLEVDAKRRHKGAWVVHFRGVDDRDLAATYALKEIAVDPSQFDELGDGDFYWHDLIGLTVISEHGDNPGERLELGCVHEMLETGANDVLVVRPTESSFDDVERLVPYVPERFVKSVDLATRQIVVEWHVED